MLYAFEFAIAQKKVLQKYKKIANGENYLFFLTAKPVLLYKPHSFSKL